MIPLHERDFSVLDFCFPSISEQIFSWFSSAAQREHGCVFYGLNQVFWESAFMWKWGSSLFSWILLKKSDLKMGCSQSWKRPKRKISDICMDIEKLSFCHFHTEINTFSKNRLWDFFSLGSTSEGWEQMKELNQQQGKIFGSRDFGSGEERERYAEAG